jgi:hypothetical protein
MKRPETPFPKHWIYYIVLKIVVLVAVVLIALQLQGLL